MNILILLLAAVPVVCYLYKLNTVPRPLMIENLKNRRAQWEKLADRGVPGCVAQIKEMDVLIDKQQKRMKIENFKLEWWPLMAGLLAAFVAIFL